jgi:hypothetical protein
MVSNSYRQSNLFSWDSSVGTVPQNKLQPVLSKLCPIHHSVFCVSINHPALLADNASKYI